MNHIRFGLLSVALGALIVALPACGGGGDGGGGTAGGVPVLAGSPIPTVALPTPTPPICTPPAQLDVPANFPQEVPLPPDFVTWSVSTTPHLQVVGRVTPPEVDPRAGIAPQFLTVRAIVDRLKDLGWTRRLNQRVDGEDYDLFAPDGRSAHLNVVEKECPGQVQITYDFNWITP
jgi:hypothetical protein